jgi:hypothetical protein
LSIFILNSIILQNSLQTPGKITFFTVPHQNGVLDNSGEHCPG